MSTNGFIGPYTPGFGPTTYLQAPGNTVEFASHPGGFSLSSQMTPVSNTTSQGLFPQAPDFMPGFNTAGTGYLPQPPSFSLPQPVFTQAPIFPQQPLFSTNPPNTYTGSYNTDTGKLMGTLLQFMLTTLTSLITGQQDSSANPYADILPMG